MADTQTNAPDSSLFGTNYMPSTVTPAGIGASRPPAATGMPDFNSLFPTKDQIAKTESDLVALTKQKMGAEAGAQSQFEKRDADNRVQMEHALAAQGADLNGLKPWDAQKELEKRETPLWEQWGSPAVFAANLLSAFTHQPMTNALNASAAAMKTIQQGDLDSYNRAMDAWKANSDLTQKRAALEHNMYEEIDHLRERDMATWRAKATAIATRFNDQRGLALLQNGMDPEFLQVKEAIPTAMAKMAEAESKINEQHAKINFINSQPGVWKTDKDGNKITDPTRYKEAMDAWASMNEPDKAAFYAAQNESYEKNGRGMDADEIVAFQKRQSEAKYSGVRSGAMTPTKQDATEIDRRTAEYEASGMPRTQAYDRAKKEVKQAGVTLLDDEAVNEMAQQYLAGDKSVFQNLGRGAQGAENVVRVRQAVERQAKEQGLSGEDVALRMAEFNALTAGERTLGTRTANVEMFVNEARNQMQVARRASAEVPRGEFVPVNRALLSFQENTGDPKVVAFGAAINTLVNTYAKAIAGGGQATVSDKDHARDILKSAYTTEQFDAVLDVLNREMEAAREAPRQVKQQFRDLAHGKELGGIPTPAPNVIKYDAEGNRVQ